MKKTILAISMSFLVLFGNCFIIHAEEEEFAYQYQFPLTLSANKVNYTKEIGFDFFYELNAPTAKADGRGAPLENLISNYGDSYIDDPYLKEEVINFRKWEWNAMYTSLDKKALENPEYLDTYRLQAEAYLVNKEYDEALSQSDRILRKNPTDIHALSLSIIACKGIKSSQTGIRLKALELICPEAYTKLLDVLKYCDDNNASKVSYGSNQLTPMIPDAIAVFGQSPNPDGSPSAGLLERLEKTKEMATKYQNAKIILSGGPVKTQYTEASVMQTWLIDQGISSDRLILDEIARDTPGNAIGMVEAFRKLDAHKILAIGTILHLPRATTILKVYGDVVGYDMSIDCAGGGSQPSSGTKETERLYTYINAARAAYIYTKEDFSKYQVKKHQVEYYDRNKALISTSEIEIGQPIALPTVSESGYELVNWQDKTGRIITNEDKISGTLQVYSTWKEKTLPEETKPNENSKPNSTYSITNSKGKSVETGDDSNTYIWILYSLLSISSCLLILIKKQKQNT